MWLCFFFHKWGKWKQLSVKMEADVFETDIQERYCLRCDRREWDYS